MVSQTWAIIVYLNDVTDRFRLLDVTGNTSTFTWQIPIFKCFHRGNLRCGLGRFVPSPLRVSMALACGTVVNLRQEITCDGVSVVSFTSGSRGGAHPARAPTNGRGPMIFYAQNANFSHFFPCSLRSRFILSLVLIDIWPKHAKNWLLLQTVNTFNDLLPPPPPLTKSTPPLRSNPGSATACNTYWTAYLNCQSIIE